MKIVACSMTIMLMSGGELQLGQYAGFTMILGIAMVAAPGIPGGAIMAALGLLQSMLGFDETAQGGMITLYIAMESFGTATNVTVAGDIAIIVNRVNKWKISLNRQTPPALYWQEAGDFYINTRSKYHY